jgi:4-diphosphocytidyl-2-C-methyl-D-erythritol kinase
LVVFPHAKINLGLHVTGKRDDGYHNIETVFYPVPLCDVLEAVEDTSSSGKITLDVTGNDSLSANDNLCAKAYELLKKDFKLPSVKAHLHKIIPAGAGLGGGSADAAFMLKLLNKIFQLKLSNDALKKYALELGSDCPFFVDGKPVYATGRGEVTQSIKLSLKNYFIAIVKPQVSVSTVEAYKMVKPQKPHVALLSAIQQPVEKWRDLITNNFEEPVFKKYPAIETIKKKLYESGAVFALMSGSGSAVYGLFDREIKLNDAFDNSFFISVSKLF